MRFFSWTRLTSEESISAQHIKVLTTALLCAAGWWESKAKYWSVCVTFRYTSVLIVLSPSVVRSMSRNGSCPPDSLSTVNYVNVQINAVEVLMEGIHQVAGKCGACVIHIPPPKTGRGVEGG